MPPNFGDLYKPVKDLLTKKYNGDGHKLDLKVKDAVTFNPVFTRKADGAVSGTAAVEGSYEACDWCLLKLKYTISSAGSLKTNVKADKLKPAGLTLEGNWDAALGDSVAKDTYDLTAKYNVKNANVEAKVAKGKAASAELNFVLAALPDLNLGGMVNYNLSSMSQQSLAVGAAYQCSAKTSVAATLQRDAAGEGIRDTLKAGFVTKGTYIFGAEYTTTLADPKKGVITAGLETALKDGQIVKGKVDTKGGIALSVQHALSKEIKLCSSLELASSKDASWASKFGTEIIYEG